MSLMLAILSDTSAYTLRAFSSASLEKRVMRGLIAFVFFVALVGVGRAELE